MTAAEWAALGVWAQVLVISVSAYLVWRQVKEARRLREEQTRPHIVVSLQIEQRMMVMLVVENLGATVAKNVNINFEPAPRLLDGELAVRQRPIPTVPPGMRLRSHMGQGFKVLEDDYQGPRRFTATVTYRDAQGRELPTDTYELDLGMFEGYAIDLQTMHELVEEVAKIREASEKEATIRQWERVERSGQERTATAETTRHGESFVSRVRGAIFGDDE